VFRGQARLVDLTFFFKKKIRGSNLTVKHFLKLKKNKILN
jgi:hypothetical protein